MASKYFSLLSVFTCLILFCTTNDLFAQAKAIGIKGIVRDKKEPLQGASVVAIDRATGKQYGVLTDNEGRFSMDKMLPNSEYKLSISYLGYETEEQKRLVLETNTFTVLDITLKEVTNILGFMSVKFDKKEIQMPEETVVPITSISKLE